MRRTAIIGLAIVFVGGGVVSALTDDATSLTAAFVACAALAVFFVVSPELRATLAGRFPRAALLGRRVMALRWRTIAVAAAACLAEHLEATYGADRRAERSPLLTAAEIDRTWPADDQRYTPVGVLLRYEREILALLPDGRGGTAFELAAEQQAFRRFHAYVGDFWGASYLEREDLPRSALAVPDESDLRALRRRLTAARSAQDVCYGWDVEIRSGAREGRVREPLPPDCDAFVRLLGWIDPNANRFEKGSRGAWELRYEWALAGEIARDSIDAIETPLIELIEGEAQQWGGGGRRAGKGLIENLDALPLLAQDLEGVPPVPVARPLSVPEEARPAPVSRSDAERRSEESWAALPIAIVRVAAIFVLVFVVLALLAGLTVRAARALR